MTHPRRKFRVLITDPMERWHCGEVGYEEENDFSEKYDVKLRFPGTVRTQLFGEEVDAARCFYFHSSEVDELPGSN